MPIDADKLLKIGLAAASAAGLGIGGYQTNTATTAEAAMETLKEQVDHWRGEVAAVRARAEAREIRDSDTCLALLEAAREGNE